VTSKGVAPSARRSCCPERSGARLRDRLRGTGRCRRALQVPGARTARRSVASVLVAALACAPYAGTGALAQTVSAGGTTAAAADPAPGAPSADRRADQEVALPVGRPGTPPVPGPDELEAQGAVIGRIIVQPDEIFDESLPGENGWIYRTANKLHIRTKPSVIRKQLLFKEGEPFRKRLIDETERMLRTHDYLYDAKITPIAYDGKSVDIEVRTKDVWTLNPGVSFSRGGGENDVGAQIEEKNLLGTGQQLKLEWESNVDRETISFGYRDPHFLHSFSRLGVAYEDADDGETWQLDFDRPFYALDTRLAGGIALLDSQRNDPRYAYGHKVGEFAHRDENHEAYGGVSRGLRNGWVTRWTAGIGYQRDTFEVARGEDPGGPLPEDRELLYPWVGIEWIQDAYQKRRNQDQIVRTEDVLLGFRAGARLGYAADGFGSDRDAMLFSGYVQNAHEFAETRSVFGSLNLSGRLESGDIANGVLSAEGRYYWQTSKNSKFYALVSGATTENLDEETQLLLGGDNGLRGYPLRYQAGTSRALLTLEQRYYTGWYPFHLFHVGAAAFFDAGRTWGRDVTGAESLGLLKDVGIGLRFGSSRSSFGNVIHVDLAFPLDGDDSIDSVQLNVETKARF
jgi:outer membrane protein assembly factor BamA